MSCLLHCKISVRIFLTVDGTEGTSNLSVKIQKKPIIKFVDKGKLQEQSLHFTDISLDQTALSEK